MSAPAPSPDSRMTRPRKRRPFVYLAAAFSVGIAVSNWLSASPQASAVWGGVCLALGTGAVLARSRRWLASALILLGTGAAGAAWFSLSRQVAGDDLSRLADGRNLPVLGHLVRREVRPDKQLLLVKAVQARLGDNVRPASGLVLVSADWRVAVGDLLPGDGVECVGALRIPHQARNPGQFSYRSYLAIRGIRCVMDATAVQAAWIPGGGTSRGIARAVGRAQRSVMTHLASSLPPTNCDLTAALAGSILFGNRASPAPDAIEEDFRRSGTIHVLVVSGSQVSVIGIVLGLMALPRPLPFGSGRGSRAASRWLLRVLRPFPSLMPFLVPLGLLLLVAYILMTGAPVTALRAGLTTGLAAVACWRRQEFDALNALAAALLILLVVSPPMLFDVSLQLSFLAAAGIALFYRPFRTALAFLPGWVAGLGATTLAAQIAVSPLLAYKFHRFSLVGLGANFLVVPLAGVALLLGGAAVLLSYLWPAAATILGAANAEAVTGMVRIAHQACQLPGASAPAALSWMGIVVIYAVLAAAPPAAARLREKPPPASKAALALGGVAAIVCAALAYQASAARLKITILDVRRGYCAVVRSPAGKVFLLDAGGDKRDAQNVILPFLLSEGIRRVDEVILTDATDERCGALAEIAEQLPVRRVRLPAGAAHTSAWETALPTLERSGAIVSGPGEGVRAGPLAPSVACGSAAALRFGQFSFQWHPGTGEPAEPESAEAGAKAVVVCAVPVGQPSERLVRLLSRPQVKAVVLMGAAGHPLPEQWRLLARRLGPLVYRTDIDGAVTILAGKGQLTVRTFRPASP